MDKRILAVCGVLFVLAVVGAGWLSARPGVTAPAYVLKMDPVNGGLEATGDPIPAPDSDPPALILEEGDLIRVPLPNTRPEDFEDAPLLTAVLTITDGFTGQPVAADVFLYRKLPRVDVLAVNIIPVIPCEGVHVCTLELAAPNDGFIWMIQVRADGYEDWIVELNFVTEKSRVMDMPVRLIKGGGVIG